MDFGLDDEQRAIVDTVRTFVTRELYPHEDEVERLGDVPPELVAQIRTRAIEVGLHAANMPAELGGGGLDAVGMTLAERELGKASYALQWLVARPSNILQACEGDQRERYLLPAVRGERYDCLAMTEPGAGSDVRSMTTRAVRDGDDYVIDGTKHFISHADKSDFVILFAATGTEEVRGRQVNLITGLPGRPRHAGPDRGARPARASRTAATTTASWSSRAAGCRPANRLGDEGRGFDLMGEWLGASRLTVAATSVGRARRVLDMTTRWAADRTQFGQPIGQFQGVGFQLADMATELEAAELLTLRAAWKLDQGTMTDQDAAMAKVFASEALGRITDRAVQIHGGMGLMDELPIERFWRDARVERIWDGTSEIQRHIISRSLLRPLGALRSTCREPRRRNLQRLLTPRSVVGHRRPAGRGRRPAVPSDRVRRRDLAGPPDPRPAGRGSVLPRPAHSFPASPTRRSSRSTASATVSVVGELARLGCRRRRVPRVRASPRTARRAPGCSASWSRRPVRWRLSGPTAWGSSTTSTAPPCGPSSTAASAVERGVALVAQSGNIAENLTMQRRSLPIAAVVTIGNSAVTGVVDLVTAMLADPRITAIGLCLEEVPDVAAFSQVALEALRRRVPIVALKSGSSELGAQVTLSHTSSLADSDVLVDALFRRLGIARVARRRDVPRDAEAVARARLPTGHSHRVGELLRRRGRAARRPRPPDGPVDARAPRGDGDTAADRARANGCRCATHSTTTPTSGATATG